MYDVFDPNVFKRSVKEWMRQNPNGNEVDLAEFCEDQIPTAHFAANNWLIEHTVSWYRHILDQRQHAKEVYDDGEEEAA
jgi:hypothetical protein